MRDIHLKLSEEQFNELLALLENTSSRTQNLIQVLQQQASEQNEEMENQPILEKEFEIGTPIQGRWNKGASWYNGTIKAFKNGLYFIQYDDGDQEWTTSEFIEALHQPGDAEEQQNFELADRVRVRWQRGAAWYNGHIKAIKDQQYFIKFDDGDEEWTTSEFMMKI